MKNIDITSDLHSYFIYSNYKNIYWNNGVLFQTWDYLIIAWDIDEEIITIQKSFDDIINLADYKKIIVTFWNHDIRFNVDDENYNIINSIEKYEFLCNHFHNYKDKIHVIDKEDFIIEETNQILTWNMGWYNYTIKDIDKFYLEKYYHVNFDKMSFWSTIFNDRRYIKFNDKIKWNLDFSKYLEDKLIKRLENIKNNYNNYEIIAISHLKPSNELEKDSPYYFDYSPEKWEEIIKDWSRWVNIYSLDSIYWNAFFVNNNLSKLYEKYWVKCAIYWHTHYNWTEKINGVEYITKAFWYYHY